MEHYDIGIVDDIMRRGIWDIKWCKRRKGWMQWRGRGDRSEEKQRKEILESHDSLSHCFDGRNRSTAVYIYKLRRTWVRRRPSLSKILL